MRGDTQSCKRPLGKSLNLHPKKPQKFSAKLFACSIQEFQFNLPSYSMPITVRNASTAPDRKGFKEELTFQPIEDYRRELIKQKIKFRVKQEMWNLIKKNYEKPAIIDPPQLQQAKTQPNPESQTPCVKGSSLTRVSRENITFRKTEMSQRKMLSRSYYKQNAKTSGQGTKHKRVWSSFVKMKEKDRMEMQKSHYRASVSSINIEKLDAYNIEPWKGFDDQEILLEDH